MKFAIAVLFLVFVAGCAGTQDIYQSRPPVQTPQQPTSVPSQQIPQDEISLTITSPSSAPAGRVISITAEAGYTKPLESLELNGEGVTKNSYACSGSTCKNTWSFVIKNPGTYEYIVTAKAANKISSKTVKIVAR